MLAVSISDPPQGFTTMVRDLTTHQTGFMTASAANGFMNTNIADCSGTPFTFHAEYSTAKSQNQVPWAALEGGVLMEQEIGHSEVCNSVTNQDPFTVSYPGGQSFSDPNVYDTCVGGSEGPNASRRGPVHPRPSARTRRPKGPPARWPARRTTRPAASCASSPTASASRRERGRRSSTAWRPRSHRRPTSASPTGYQNGDLDFDGLAYLADVAGREQRTTRRRSSTPGRSSERPYRTRRSSSRPTSAARRTCATPPPARAARPRRSAPSSTRSGRSASWPVRVAATACVWNFGNELPQDQQDFGKDAQYGTPDVACYGGTLISAPRPNPEFSGRCKI